MRYMSTLHLKDWGDIETSIFFRMPQKMMLGTMFPEGKYTADLSYQKSFYNSDNYTKSKFLIND